MKRMKKFLSLLLALVMLLGLAACGKTDGDAPAMPKGVDFRPAAFYKAEKIPLPDENGFVVGSCADGETLYYMLEEEDGTFTLYRAGLAEGTVEKLPGYTPAEAKNELRVFPWGLRPDGQGGLWLLETWTSIGYKLPDDFDPEKDDKYLFSAERGQHAVLRRLDGSTGREKESVDLSAAGIWEDWSGEWSGDWTVDGQGRLYLTNDTGITVLDAAGKELFTLGADIELQNPLGGRRQVLALLTDGTVGVLMGGSGSGTVKIIDIEKKGWGETAYSVPSETGRIYPGQRGFLFLSATDKALYGHAVGESAPYKLLTWDTAGIAGGAVQSFSLLAEDSLAALSQTGEGLSLSCLTPSATDEDGRTVITLGAILPSSYVLYSVDRFNADESNDAYYVAVRDYAEDLMDNGMTGMERIAAARKRLEVEMVSGRVPDLILGENLPLSRYAGKGVLEDLWPWIDGDSELGRDKLMTHVLDCASVDGKLYHLGGSFSINSLAAPAGRFPEGERPALEDVLALYETMPEGSLLLDSGMGPDYVLGVLSMGGESFVDWTTGECSFDSPEFAKLLELCARTPQNTEWLDDGGRALREGHQLLTSVYLGQLSNLMKAEALCGGPDALWDYEQVLRDNGINDPVFNTSDDIAEMEKMGLRFGEDTAFGALKEGAFADYVGFPTLDGNYAGAFSWTVAYAMTAASEHKDGAWAFLRTLLLPGGGALPGATDAKTGEVLYSKITSFPVNKADFETFVAQEMEPQYFTDKDWDMIRSEDGELPADAKLILDQDGQPIETPGAAGTFTVGRDPISLYVYRLAARQSDLDRLMALYNEADRFDLGRDESLWNIVVSQAAAYFAGDAALDETVRSIQSRAELYLGEQK